MKPLKFLFVVLLIQTSIINSNLFSKETETIYLTASVDTPAVPPESPDPSNDTVPPTAPIPPSAESLNYLLNKLDSIQKNLDSLTDKLDDKELYDKINKDFQFSVGGNLDFLEKVRVDGLYYDINFFLKQPFGNHKCKFLKVFGIEGRMLQGRLVNNSDTFYNRINTYHANIEGSDTTMTEVKQSYNYYALNSPKYLILNLMPTFKIAEGSTDNGKNYAALYFAVYSEYFRNIQSTMVKYDILSQDSIIVDYDSTTLSRYQNVIDTFPLKLNVMDHYFNSGLGLKFLYENKYIKVDVTPVFGVGRVKVSSLDSQRGMFYSVSSEIQERHFGFKIGARISGTYKKEDSMRSYAAYNNKPRVYVYFAKTFSFAAIGKFLKGD